jgi:hypothetical protein
MYAIFFHCSLSNSHTDTLNSTVNHDVRHTDYEGDLVGAVGRVMT